MTLRPLPPVGCCWRGAAAVGPQQSKRPGVCGRQHGLVVAGMVPHPSEVHWRAVRNGLVGFRTAPAGCPACHIMGEGGVWEVSWFACPN